MASVARTKSKPKQKVKKEDLKTGRRILIEDLRVGDRIVTSWHTSIADANGHGNMTVDEVMDVLKEGETNSRYVNRSTEIRKFEECPSQWRTHVHINGSDCYDMRGWVWIVVQ